MNTDEYESQLIGIYIWFLFFIFYFFKHFSTPGAECLLLTTILFLWAGATYRGYLHVQYVIVLKFENPCTSCLM
ncbi:hypothetical protein HOY82DRAFT_19581 [Tuber indicum]|nr:hypothetical protein HOY82DRAFT_19581 [Tuber indicum]